MKVFVVIPIYNEDPVVVCEVITQAQSIGFMNICIVDDGSAKSFATAEECSKIEKSSITVLRHGINRGKGAAIKTGMEFVKAQGGECVVTIDGDGQHIVSDMCDLLAQIENGHDVVLGSRFLPRHAAKDVPQIRVGANKIANFFTYLFFGLRVSDSQSGLRAFGQKALNCIDTQNDRYAYDSEIIHEIKRHNLSFTEIPISVLYTEYSLNKSTRQSLTGGLKTLYNFFLMR